MLKPTITTSASRSQDWTSATLRGVVDNGSGIGGPSDLADCAAYPATFAGETADGPVLPAVWDGSAAPLPAIGRLARGPALGRDSLEQGDHQNHQAEQERHGRGGQHETDHRERDA